MRDYPHIYLLREMSLKKVTLIIWLTQGEKQWQTQSLLNVRLMWWKLNLESIIGVSAAAHRINPFVMVRMKERSLLLWKLTSPRKNKWPFAAASAQKPHHFVMVPTRLSDSESHEVVVIRTDGRQHKVASSHWHHRRYSYVDINKGVTLTIPETNDRYVSAMVVNTLLPGFHTAWTQSGH